MKILLLVLSVLVSMTAFAKSSGKTHKEKKEPAAQEKMIQFDNWNQLATFQFANLTGASFLNSDQKNCLVDLVKKVGQRVSVLKPEGTESFQLGVASVHGNAQVGFLKGEGDDYAPEYLKLICRPGDVQDKWIAYQATNVIEFSKPFTPGSSDAGSDSGSGTLVPADN